MQSRGNIQLGIILQQTEKGLLLTSPDLEDFCIGFDKGTVADMMNLLNPAIKLFMFLKGIDIQSTFLAVDGQSGSVQPEQKLESGIWYRLTIVPKKTITPPSPA